ncbi:hypothetical protein AMJ52_03930 [candidate division TA06 bacterium DG_78]|uniref:Uncharacterized protein n=1 Tax=candidate division TA06 bacterium DG_78 TaxID=1703772 RepID=A0A0S7YF68_UNCT6|nr:MAG: hypothetical protein AMJ52_03930 [candidate division TA06 bacterium DG_78]
MIEKIPGDYRYYFDLGLSYMASENYGDALKALNRALDLNSNYTLAKEKFEELREILPDTKAIYDCLGFIYFILGEYEKMSEYTEDMVKKQILLPFVSLVWLVLSCTDTEERLAVIIKQYVNANIQVC